MQTKTVNFKPAKPGLIVRDPVTMRPLAESGEPKPFNKFWLRQFQCGDVVEVVKPKRTTKTKTEQQAEGAAE